MVGGGLHLATEMSEEEENEGSHPYNLNIHDANSNEVYKKQQ